MMDARIPRKTPIGVEEIKTRSRGLPARLRTLLLLVDGERSVQALNQLVHLTDGAAPALANLVERGLVEIPDAIPDAAPPIPPETQAQAPRQAIEDEAVPATAPPDAAPQTAEFSDSKMRLAAMAAAALKANPETRRKAPEPRPEPAPATAVVEADKEGELAIVQEPAARTTAEASAAPPRKAIEEKSKKTATARKPRKEVEQEAAQKTPKEIPAAPAKASAPAPQASADPIETAFLVARAHLANVLDENLGVEGYALRQKVTNSTSVRELISHFDAIEESLIGSLGIAGATNVILRTLAILQTP